MPIPPPPRVPARAPSWRASPTSCCLLSLSQMSHLPLRMFEGTSTWVPPSLSSLSALPPQQDSLTSPASSCHPSSDCCVSALLMSFFFRLSCLSCSLLVQVLPWPLCLPNFYLFIRSFYLGRHQCASPSHTGLCAAHMCFLGIHASLPRPFSP